MPVELYLYNPKTKARFKVVKYDKATNKVTLRGQYAEFVEVFDRAKFIKRGYTLERKDVPDSEVSDA